MHTHIHIPTCLRFCALSISPELKKEWKELHLNELNVAFSDSQEHTAQFFFSVTAQHKVHELVNHDSPVLLFPSFHSFWSFIKKSYQLHQSTVLNNRQCGVRKREMQGTAIRGLVVYSECVWKIIWQSHSNVHTEGFILFILSVCLCSHWSIHLSMVLMACLSMFS